MNSNSVELSHIYPESQARHTYICIYTTHIIYMYLRYSVYMNLYNVHILLSEKKLSRNLSTAELPPPRRAYNDRAHYRNGDNSFTENPPHHLVKNARN